MPYLRLLSVKSENEKSEVTSPSNYEYDSAKLNKAALQWLHADDLNTERELAQLGL